jgi:hypothetical protein
MTIFIFNPVIILKSRLGSKAGNIFGEKLGLIAIAIKIRTQLEGCAPSLPSKYQIGPNTFESSSLAMTNSAQSC